MIEKKIILASTSPFRKQVMDEIGIPYTIVPSGFEENNELFTNPYELIEEFAYQKAKRVFERFPDAVVIGSDTIVADADGVPRGKAKNYNDAVFILQSLQGRTCTIVTAVAVLAHTRKWLGYDEVSVRFKPMSEAEIRSYLDESEEWKDHAGAFAGQGRAKEWIEEIRGDYTTMVGLTRPLVESYLHEAVVPWSSL